MSKRRAVGDFAGVPVISAPGIIQGIDDEMHVQMLGAGQEVGRSCCVIKYKGRTIVCDTGVHPAFSGMAALPFLDELDWSTVDAILITHFHLDHAASLTYVMEKVNPTNFREGNGVVYMSHPTKAVYRFLMSDFVRVSTAGSDDKLFTEEEMLASWSTIIGFDFEQEILLPASNTPESSTSSSSNAAVRFTSFAAGHVLGACMFLIEIAGLRVLYTGDYSTEEDRHLVPAKLPIWEKKPDVMICESTYGQVAFISSDGNGRGTDSVICNGRFAVYKVMNLALVSNIIKRGGRVLLPVFALGRAQEILLILDEYWAAHPELHHVPIYYISSLALKCMDVYRQYIHTMSPNVREKFARGINPFDFKAKTSFIRPLERGLAKLNDKGPCVVMASPGFLTNGTSRELLEKWAPDPRNGLIITGYSVEGVMARTIMNEPTEIQALNGGAKISRRLSVDYISFSAHVDYTQNAKFIDEVMPAHLILVHGEANNMSRLRSALKTKFAERKDDIQIYTPRNVETVKIRFRGERMAKALGTLAETTPKAATPLSGLLVSKDFTYTFLAPSDLRDFTGLSTSIILQRQRLTLSVSWELVQWHLQGMYGKIQQGVDKEGLMTMRIMDTVDVKAVGKMDWVVEWVGSVSNDMVADSVIALVLGVDKSPASVKKTSMGASSHCSHRHPHAEPTTPPSRTTKTLDDAEPTGEETSQEEDLPTRLDRLIAFLDSYFGKVELVIPKPKTAGDSSPPLESAAEPEEKATEPSVPMEGDTELGPPTTTTTNPEGEEHFAEVETTTTPTLPTQPLMPVIRVHLDDLIADVRVEDLQIICENESFKARVENVVGLAMAVVRPLSGIGAGAFLESVQEVEEGPRGKRVAKVVEGEADNKV
ncbi:BZ3500_MvSof-1268-A1-R1_Chr2-1g04374 [Microbotryum saponariae]|uniref:BZ3500_MvSof-1268-A1-R1_Chr2-1g04374 protein n=1 Tax=Microbotryum saponariae TaxID=289078 RepID=A0A2X0MIU4_9BASI|nr:BZ3500_MvSof-1268-A1-R1_Chr2-1g04374 [Microbotryum saponariae]SCZ91585.1 BZ3501_MvSof-1269-A2-R1_Chr2-1g04030 [Microbotryum saponariae]